jgi:hypothetical protein
MEGRRKTPSRRRPEKPPEARRRPEKPREAAELICTSAPGHALACKPMHALPHAQVHMYEKLASYSACTGLGMHEDVRARCATQEQAIYVQMPYHYKMMELPADEVFLWDFFAHLRAAATTSHRFNSPPCIADIPLQQLRRRSKTDEAGRYRRMPLMSQLRYTGSWTDEVMDEADDIYTATTTHAWRTVEKIEDDDHNSRIGGTPAS